MIDLLTSEKIEDLKSRGATGAELRKATLLNNDLKRAMAALNDESSTSIRKNFAEAEEVYQQYVGELIKKYFSAAAKADQSGEFFSNRKEAHEWLQANGYAVSSGKFYQDIKRKGFPVVNPDKTVSKYQVMVYAKGLQAEQQPDPTALSRSEFLHRKEKADADIAEMKAERMRREEDAFWLRAEDAWSVVAALIGDLREVIRRYMLEAQIEIVQAAGGEELRGPEVFELLDQITNRAFNEIASAPMEINWASEE